MPNLYPTIEPAETFEAITTEEASYPTATWVFDFDAGEFAIIPPGRVKPITDDRLTTFLEWARKAIITARYRYPVYDDQYGSELESLLGDSLPRGIADNELRRMVDDCLRADPRTADVRDISIDWTDPEAPVVSCTLVSIWGDQATLSQELPNG